MILLDTHALTWWLWEDRRLSARAREILEEPGSDIVVSAISAWEVALKFKIGKWPEAETLALNFEVIVESQGFDLLSLSATHARLGGLIDSPHRDPFDRLLAAQAMALNIPVLSQDAKLHNLGATVIW